MNIIHYRVAVVLVVTVCGSASVWAEDEEVLTPMVEQSALQSVEEASPTIEYAQAEPTEPMDTVVEPIDDTIIIDDIPASMDMVVPETTVSDTTVSESTIAPEIMEIDMSDHTSTIQLISDTDQRSIMLDGDEVTILWK